MMISFLTLAIPSLLFTAGTCYCLAEQSNLAGRGLLNLEGTNSSNGQAMLELPGESPREDDLTRTMEGWMVHIDGALWQHHRAETETALALLRKQLAEIVGVVPAPALAKLREVPLWLSPEYPGLKPKAEYHPSAAWLSEHGRNPEMAKSVEFTNVRIFPQELNRMPNFALHELAHAYHDRVLPYRFANPEIKAAFDRARMRGSYEKVERWNGHGRPNTIERAYAMTNPQEYFAESTEAFFSRNDFFPFTRAELEKHDPRMFELLGRLWNPSTLDSAKPSQAPLQNPSSE